MRAAKADATKPSLLTDAIRTEISCTDLCIVSMMAFGNFMDTNPAGCFKRLNHVGSVSS